MMLSPAPVEVRVDRDQCRRLAERIAQVRVRPDEFLVRVTTAAERRREANLWFFLVAICQATRTLQGTLDGTWYRGWDYMVHAARRALRVAPDGFTAAHLVHTTGDSLCSLFADDGVAEHSTLDRIPERVAQWRATAQLLLARYAGDVMNLYAAADQRLRGAGGILARLAEFEAYSDPVEKKSFLFIMFAQRSGAWAVADVEHLKVAIDYHVMRVALRSGMVRVADAALAQRLKARSPVSADEDNALREAVRPACDLLVQHAGQSVFDVDNTLWMMGRNCCFYDYEPICGDHACWRQSQCTFVRSIAYACPGRCLFDGVCLGSRDPAFRAYWETTLYTRFY